jgi:site-specific recombinase XerD
MPTKKSKKQGENMNQIAARITAIPTTSPEEMAMRIKSEAPTLSDLSGEQLEMIAKLVMTQRLTNELNAKVDLAGINWNLKRESFLSDTKSPHTRRAYSAALEKLEAWANREGLNPLELSAATADQFIRELKAGGKSAATVRRDIAAISAFYSFLERYHSAIKNPIRGTKIRPPKEISREIIIPTAAEYHTIIQALPAVERAIVITMATRGLRIGALPTLELKNGKYQGKSKAKVLTENNTAGITLPQESLEAIKKAGLNIKKPFAWKTKNGSANSANAAAGRINYHIGKLFKSGKITATYSCHDFRHFYAIQEYQKNKDIFRLSKLLNHAGVQVTQIYLQKLGIEL